MFTSSYPHESVSEGIMPFSLECFTETRSRISTICVKRGAWGEHSPTSILQKWRHFALLANRESLKKGRVKKLLFLKQVWHICCQCFEQIQRVLVVPWKLLFSDAAGACVKHVALVCQLFQILHHRFVLLSVSLILEQDWKIPHHVWYIAIYSISDSIVSGKMAF